MNKKIVSKIFQTSWGYDQTNYDFVKVIRITKSGKTAICKKVNKLQVDSNGYYDDLKPGEEFGPEFRLKIETTRYDGTDTGKFYLRGSYPFLSRFEGEWTDEQKEDWLSSKRLDTFSEVEKGRTYAQTNSQFGH